MNRTPAGTTKVYLARQRLEAEMIKAILQDGGLSATVHNEGMEAAGIPQQFVGFVVCVPDEQADEARALLQRPGGADWTCPNCAEKIDGVFDACWKCGQERGEA